MSLFFAATSRYLPQPLFFLLSGVVLTTDACCANELRNRRWSTCHLDPSTSFKLDFVITSAGAISKALS